MSTPIKSSTSTVSSQGAVSGAGEILARLQAQVRGAEGQAAPQSFASLMNQQGQSWQSSPTPSQATTPKAAPRQPASQDPAARAQAAARANEQALARVRQQALATQKTPVQPESVPSEPASTSAPVKSERGVERGARTGSVSDGGEARAATESGRVEGEVKEGPAEDVKPVADSVSMMAWLAGLPVEAKPDTVTGAEALAAGAEDLPQDEGHVTELLATDADALAQEAAGVEADPGSVALDLTQWQQTTTLAGLQLEGLLGRAGSGDLGAELSRSEATPLAGLSAGVNVRPGGLPSAAPVRHESATLPTPLGHADFGQALAEKVSLWVNTARTDGPMTAELHLNPADMGPIQVKIALEGQSAQVDFAAAAAETRKAIEASMSALSSALSDVGLNLTGGGVSSQTAQQSFGQQSAPSDGARGVSAGSSASAGAGEEGDGSGAREVRAPRVGRPGGLDLYA